MQMNMSKYLKVINQAAAASVMADSVRPCGLQPAISSVHGILQARIFLGKINMEKRNFHDL